LAVPASQCSLAGSVVSSSAVVPISHSISSSPSSSAAFPLSYIHASSPLAGFQLTASPYSAPTSVPADVFSRISFILVVY
jgi:hypothetical protein